LNNMPMFKTGDFIGQKYEICRVLGLGGFGVVYLVYSHETRSVYALKTFHDQYIQDIAIRNRFQKEAEVWINLERYPYIVRAHLVEEIGSRLFIAMEYIAPAEKRLNSLDGYLKAGPLELAQVLRWSIQFCYGMEYAYSRGLKSHRDIKPTNILIGSDGAIRISDFEVGCK